MPAETPIYGLPYQVGTDPPCFGPGTGCDNLETLWCDFAAIVEQQLDDMDAVAGRTGTAIPMARVLFSPDNTAGLSPTISEAFPAGFLAFDTVQFDTDNMATLPFGITPRRNGRYRIDANINIASSADAGLQITCAATVGPEVPPLFPLASLTQVVPPSGTFTFVTALRGSTLYEFSGTGPLPRVIQIEEWGPIASDAQVFSGSLTVYWHSDL